jgi:two-component system sensor histidine kinase KdpD
MGTDTLPGAAAVYVPLRGSQAVLGVLGVRPQASLLPLTPDHMDLLETLASQAASALERVRLAGDAEGARVEAEAERLRSTLLSSVSHDFRTPLAAITGAASGLLGDASLTGETRADLARTIYEEAERLNRLVANLLDMTRLESGSLRLRKEWHSLEELVGAAAGRIEKLLAGRRLRVTLPPDLPLVSVDAVLIEQLLFNLLENAVRHTPPDTTIAVMAAAREGELLVSVANDGPALPPGDEERIFDKFYRRPAPAPGGTGVGLGLAIGRAIVKAHGGRIWAENLPARGVAFRFALPAGGAAPAAPQDTADELA